jgi:hypothetical protein
MQKLKTYYLKKKQRNIYKMRMSYLQLLHLSQLLYYHVSLLNKGKTHAHLVNISLLLSQEEAEKYLQDAHEFCPYSKATRGNIEVDLNVAVN